MALTRAEATWSLTEAANEPYFNLVQRYVFAPYFTGAMAVGAGQGEGAAVWGFALGAAGLAIAVLAPVLGSIADSGARLKPWLAASGLVTLIACASLWFAAPGASILGVAFAVFVATVAIELMFQFANAFLTLVSRSDRMGLLSGLSFGIGQVAGIAALLIMLAISQHPPAFLQDIPHGIERLSGPIAAAAVLLFLTPFLLSAQDRVSAARASATQGLKDLRQTLVEAFANREMRLFLIGRMIAADGLAVVFLFGAVLAAEAFGWKPETLTIFGLIITAFGAIGGFLGGWLDGRIGPKALMQSGILLVAIGAGSVLLTDSTRLFGITTGVPVGAPLASPQEWGFLVAGALIAAGAAFTLSGMRTMMALLAPPTSIAAYFGLYSFVGKATTFVGPFLVGLIAVQTGSVRGGVGLALLFLLAGFLALQRVRAPDIGGA